MGDVHSRVINYPMRGIGDTTLARLTTAAQAAGVPLWDVVERPENYATELNGSVTARLHDFADLIKGFSAQLTTKDAYELGMQILVKSGVAKALNENVEEKERVDHVTGVGGQRRETGADHDPEMDCEFPPWQ